jgi:hypothetical protein
VSEYVWQECQPVRLPLLPEIPYQPIIIPYSKTEVKGQKIKTKKVTILINKMENREDSLSLICLFAVSTLFTLQL